MITLSVAFPKGPRRVKHENPAMLEYRGGRSIFNIVFGMPVFCIGLGLLLGGIPTVVWKFIHSALDLHEWQGLSLGILIIAGAGSMFTFAGTICIFHRDGVVFDKTAGTVTTWWRVLWWHSTAVHELKMYSQAKAYCSGENFRSGPTYSIALMGKDGDELDVAVVRVSSKLADQVVAEIRAFLGFASPPDRIFRRSKVTPAARESS